MKNHRKKNTWMMKIEDPTGETRVLPLIGALGRELTLGRGDEADIRLNDATVSPQAARLWAAAGDDDATDGPFWLRVGDEQGAARLCDLEVRETRLPEDVPFRLGESRLRLVRGWADPKALPGFPAGARPWLTRSELGRQLLWTARKAAATPLSIYLAGETGSGKEVLAELVHSWSDRASGPFVPLNCAALPLSLAESELFGHVRGAFTGADQARAGALMQAHGGTLFLDEVGDLPPDIQVKLLRFLENGEIRPVGADRASRADARLVCATHLPLEKLVEEGRFRRDLYYRLASVTVRIPALRERPEDVALLATRFAERLRRTLTPRAILRLQAHDWPGNVRELQHAVERACGLAGPFAPLLGEEAFDFLLTPGNVTRNPELRFGAAALSLAEMERAMLVQALRLANGNRARAAGILGVARSTLFVMIKRHKLRPPRES